MVLQLCKTNVDTKPDFESIWNTWPKINPITRMNTSIYNILTCLKIMFRYDIGEQLSDWDKALLLMALKFHPQRKEKIGNGAVGIKVSSSVFV